MKRLLLSLAILSPVWSLCQPGLDSFGAVNSTLNELNPVVSPDGQSLYFTIANHAGNMAGRRDPGDIWISRLVDDQWTAPINAGSVLNDNAYNAVAGFSSDGSMVLLSHYSSTNRAASTQGISVSQNTGMGWGRPQNVSIPYFKNFSSSIAGQVNTAGTVFVFSAETNNGVGAEDIFVTLRRNGQWSEPVNLGPVVNTALQELSPSLAPNGKTLYFSTNGRQGYGSYDIFSSQRLDDTWQNWSPPVNLGSEVNSEGRELFYKVYPELGFALYTSTQNSDGYGDVRIYFPEPESMDSLIINSPVNVVKLEEIKRDQSDAGGKRITVWGSVTDATTNEPVSSKLSFQADTSLATSSGSDGEFSLDVPSIGNYVVRVEAPGYVGVMERLEVSTFEMSNLEMNFRLQPIAIGTTVNLKSVLFRQSTDVLLEESFDELDMVADFLNTNPNVEIELAGHTDNRGRQADNLRLSRERVSKVKDYLVSRGIDGKRISGEGYGGLRPIADNAGEATRRLNRRVEFIITRD